MPKEEGPRATVSAIDKQGILQILMDRRRRERLQKK